MSERQLQIVLHVVIPPLKERATFANKGFKLYFVKFIIKCFNKLNTKII